MEAVRSDAVHLYDRMGFVGPNQDKRGRNQIDGSACRKAVLRCPSLDHGMHVSDIHRSKALDAI
jgi:hypothetical protein